MKIGVFGTGGVGGYYGGRIAQAERADVHFIARGRHLAAMLENGLSVISPHGDFTIANPNATDDPAKVGACDAVLVCTKLWDLAGAVDAIAPMVGPETLVVSLQNGVDAEPLLLERYGPQRVAGGTVYIPAEIVEPGVVRQNNPMTRLVVGSLDGKPDPRVSALHAAADLPEVNAELSDNIFAAIWIKFSMLACHSGLTTAHRKTIGWVMEHDRGRMSDALDEAIAVGRAECPGLPDDLHARQMTALDGMAYEMKSSMQQDLERGGRLELPWLSGTIARLGRAHGIPTPCHDELIREIKANAAGTPSSEGLS